MQHDHEAIAIEWIGRRQGSITNEHNAHQWQSDWPPHSCQQQGIFRSEKSKQYIMLQQQICLCHNGEDLRPPKINERRITFAIFPAFEVHQIGGGVGINK